MVEEVHQPLMAAPGRIARIDHEYKRNGVCNIFLAVEPLTGQRLLRVTERRTKKDWAKFIEEVAENYSHAEKITLVSDNLNTHTPGAFYETFHPERAKSLLDRFELIYTPVHGSWLNMAEIELSALFSQCLSQRRIECINLVQEQVRIWEIERNKKGIKINWQFRTDDVMIKLKRLYPTFEE
jgi:hypothetical protein